MITSIEYKDYLNKNESGKDCFFCKKEIKNFETCYSITKLCHKTEGYIITSGYANLYFHPKCFINIAGEFYTIEDEACYKKKTNNPDYNYLQWKKELDRKERKILFGVIGFCLLFLVGVPCLILFC